MPRISEEPKDMDQPSNRPRVFVSSTINDLRDLRSALKYWLEEMGLEARMSEFNDFERRPEQGTFDSCFTAIADCDYYILLIGSRKGSVYEGDVSVTQQEYRTAAALAKQGKTKPVIFVRAEVLTALDERAALLANGIEPETAGSSPKRQAMAGVAFHPGIAANRGRVGATSSRANSLVGPLRIQTS
jgi:Domain of unknown function (DUF4062)